MLLTTRRFYIQFHLIRFLILHKIFRQVIFLPNPTPEFYNLALVRLGDGDADKVYQLKVELNPEILKIYNFSV